VAEAGAERRGPLFEPENELEEAMLAALLDPGAMDGFLTVLAGHQVLVPLNPEGPTRKPAAGELRVPVVEFEGRRGVPAFTSSGQLASAMSGEVRCLRFTGRQLGRAWGADDIPLLLNPGGTLGLEVAADTLRGLPEDSA
jgi:SseB protein N-terminal domain